MYKCCVIYILYRVLCSKCMIGTSYLELPMYSAIMKPGKKTCAYCEDNVSKANYARHIRRRHPWLPVPVAGRCRRPSQAHLAMYGLIPLGLPTAAAGTAGPATAGSAAPNPEAASALDLLSTADAATIATEQSAPMEVEDHEDVGEFKVPL